MIFVVTTVWNIPGMELLVPMCQHVIQVNSQNRVVALKSPHQAPQPLDDELKQGRKTRKGGRAVEQYGGQQLGNGGLSEQLNYRAGSLTPQQVSDIMEFFKPCFNPNIIMDLERR